MQKTVDVFAESPVLLSAAVSSSTGGHSHPRDCEPRRRLGPPPAGFRVEARRRRVRRCPCRSLPPCCRGVLLVFIV
jgi:hypothetical protein